MVVVVAVAHVYCSQHFQIRMVNEPSINLVSSKAFVTKAVTTTVPAVADIYVILI